jgi:hypothetical protein
MMSSDKKKNKKGSQKFRHKYVEGSSKKKKQETGLYEYEDGLKELTFRKRWWRQISDEDPITLEPLKSLKYPPFPLSATTSTIDESLEGRQGNGVHYFDGKALAEYLTSESDFRHPISRRDLTILDCQKLDAYLKKHRISLDRKNVSVTSVFRMASVIRKRQQQDSSSRRRGGPTESQNRRAAVALSRLIQFSSYNDDSEVTSSATPSSLAREDRPTEFRYIPVVQSDSNNYRVFDDDDWVADTRLEQEAFPALPSTNTTMTTTTTNNAYSWRNRVSERHTAPQQRDFPTLLGQSNNNNNNNNNNDSSSWRARFGNGSLSRIQQQQRKRLVLKPRTNTTTILSTTRNSNIFGSGKARDVASSEKLSDEEKRTHELERYEQALCPYSPDLLIFAKSNIQIVTSVERKLNEFLNQNTTNATKYIDFPPQKMLYRSIVRAICLHWGLEAEGIDREPHRSIRVSKTTASRIPKTLLWEAVLRYDHLIGKKKITALRFSEVQQRRTLHFGNIHAPGGRARPTVTSIHEILQACMGHTLRRSEYNVILLSNYLTDVLIEFTTNKMARKASARLIESFGERETNSSITTISTARLSGRTQWIRYKSFRCWLQWWGSDSYWASEQMNMREDARERLSSSSTSVASRALNGDAWDDEEEEKEKDKNKKKSIQAMKRVMEKEEKDEKNMLNMWDALQSGDDDDEDEEKQEEVWENRIQDLVTGKEVVNNDGDCREVVQGQCKKCTFINAPDSTRCDICQNELCCGNESKEDEGGCWSIIK